MSTTKLPSSILERIGDTSLVELNRMVPEGGARILLKMEAENPSGSMKDRMALAMVEAAERDGRLGDGGHVIEYTGGSTGVSLALVAAVKGHALSIVTSDAFSLEKRDHMAALGAELTIVPSIEGGMSAALTREMVETARRITARTGGFWANQLENADQLPAYHQMGEEIWRQTEGRIDAFVQSAGTAAPVRGTSEALHRRNPAIHCLAVEPAESAVLSGGPTGSIESRVSAPASSCRSGTRKRSTTSRRCRATRRCERPAAWRSRRESSPAPPPGPTSPPPSGWARGSAPAPQS